MILTQQQIEDRVGAAECVRLTDDAGSGAVNTTVLTAVAEDGEAEILGNIAQRYQLPLDLSDSVTRRMVLTKLLDVVEYRLIRRRDVNVAETVAQAYRDAIKWSESIAAGKLGLPGETGLSESPAQGATVVIATNDQVFGRENMSGL